MYKKILVAAGLDDLSPRVVQHAIGMCRAFDSECFLVHAIEPVRDADEDDAEIAGFYERLESRARAHLADHYRLFTENDVKCSGTIAVGERWRVILETCRNEGCDLIIIGSRQTDGNEPRLGTTSHKVFFAARTSVLVVRA